jgi:hypothetical protein
MSLLYGLLECCQKVPAAVFIYLNNSKFQAGRMAQAVQHLPSKRVALSSNPSATKK